MKIEKVSKYVPVVTGTSGNRDGSGGTVRSMLVSIPRVEFLEKDRESTEFYHQYTTMQDIPVTPNSTFSQEWVEKIRVLPMTKRELIIEQMLNDGNTYKQIGTVLGLAKGTIPAYVHRIRAKRAYLTMQENNDQTTD